MQASHFTTVSNDTERKRIRIASDPSDFHRANSQVTAYEVIDIYIPIRDLTLTFYLLPHVEPFYFNR